MAEDLRYTSFPDLRPDLEPPERSQNAAEWTWKIDNVSLPTEIAIRAWASLLHCYTGDDAPIFCLDGKAVRVETSGKPYTKVDTKIPEPPANGNRTGLFIHSGSQQGLNTSDLALELHYDTEKAQLTLLSLLNTSSEVLEQLGHRFLWTAQQLQQSATEVVGVRPTEILLSVLNPHPILLEGPCFLHRLVQWSEYKSSCAIDFLNSNGERTSLSYQFLDRLSSNLAARLEHAIHTLHGTQDDNVIIPVLVPQSPALYVAILAILKAGAAFCPLNLDAPEERVKFILRDVSAKIFVTTTLYKDKFADMEDGFEIVLADLENQTSEAKAPALLSDSLSDPKSLAYVMYTSGSTGLPKGVAVSHRAATQALLGHDQHIPSFKRFLQFAAPTFDVSVFEIFFPLSRGSTLVCCDRGEMLTDLPGIMRKLEVDAAELTPTVAGSLLRSRTAVPMLKFLLTIGEMLTRSIIDEFGQSSFKDAILYGMYGPTEAAIHCTISPAMKTESKVGIIGKPLASVSAFILSIEEPEGPQQNDPHVIPLGEIGELAIGGYQLANGYLNRHEQTAKSFVTHPLYGPIYRTGDKARMLTTGELEYLGRISDGQVKLRGQRVELGEIEEVVCKTQGVQTAVATIIGGRLVVFCIVENMNIPPNRIQETCRQWLPKFMIPGDYVLIQMVPRLPSGKIDKKKLAEDYQKSRSFDTADDEPYEDALERTVGRCAKQVFERPIGRFVSLSALGLDSLSAIRLASMLRKAGITVPVPKILEADSIHAIHALALSIENVDFHARAYAKELAWNAVREQVNSAILDRSFESHVQEITPCSPVQQAMLAKTLSNPHAYFNWIQLSIQGNFSSAQLQDAFRALASENEILRSGFVEIEVRGQSHAQVIWKDLQDNQFQIVDKLQFKHSLISNLNLLRPFHVQILKSDDNVQLFVNIHHALYDGWSWELLIADLQLVLDRVKLTPRPQHRLLTEFASGQEGSDSFKLSLDYWRDSLEGITVLPFPNFNDTVDVIPEMRTIRRILDLDLSKVSKTSQNLRISRPAYFQAAFSYLLSSYLGSSDIIFGSVSSGRTLPIDGIEDIIGPCITTLPFRMNLSFCRTIGDVLAVVQDLNRKLIEHGIVPLRDIQKVSRLDTRVPLFDTLLVWQETLRTGKEALRNIAQVNSSDSSEFILTLELEPHEEEVHAKATFQISVLPPSQVESLLNQLADLVTIFVNHPELPLEEIDSYLNPPNISIENIEYNQLLPSVPESLTTNMERLASQDPTRTAIEFIRNFEAGSKTIDVERVSYAQLNGRANMLASCLVGRGVETDELICIFLEKSVDLYISILGVVKAGAAYLPLTPQTPMERVITILQEARVRLCLTDSVGVEKLSSVPGLICLTVEVLDPGLFSDLNPSVQRAHADLAYAVFTSGSTGKPKGVLITRGNLFSNIQVLSKLYPYSAESKLLQACSQAFDVSVFEIFFAWHTGMCLCSATNDILFRDIETTIQTMQVTHLSLTPTVAALIRPERVPSVQFLVTSGEGVTSKVFKNWAGRGLYQGYGPSETTNICTVKPAVLPNGRINDIGPPMKNTSVFVALSTSNLQPVLRGGVGELCFGGEQVGRGYLNLPKQTSEKFLNHPLFGRVYCSGDLGRLLPSGTLLFLSRQDDQVKLRGQRVELGEINHCLLDSSYVSDCATLVVEDKRTQSQRLISFWKYSNWDRGGEVFTDELGTRCSALFAMLEERLPAYMIPSTLMPVRSLPITSQGKINKKKLQQDFSLLDSSLFELFSRGSNRSEMDKQMTEQEQIIAQALAAVIGVPESEIRQDTSFFNVGLDSISAIPLSRLLRKAGLGQIDVSIILRHSSIRRLCSAICLSPNGHIAKPELNQTKSITQVFGDPFLTSTKELVENMGQRARDILPCTPLQEAMLAKCEHQTTVAYFNRTLLRIHGDIDRLKDAWSEIIHRHDILRTCFISTEDLRYPFAQVVLEDFALPWTVIEISNDWEIEIERFQTQMAAMKNDFQPLWSLTVVDDTENDQLLLLLSMHHALYDAEAMKQLLREIEQLVQGVQLDPPVSFKTLLCEIVSLDDQKTNKFWSNQLADFEPHRWPTSTTSSSVTLEITHSSPTCSLSWIENECRNQFTSLLPVFQATWIKLLCAYFGVDDVCLGNVFSCRTLPVEGVERIVGPCFNTLPIRAKVRPNLLNKDLVSQLQKTNFEILPFQLSSLRRIQSQTSTQGQRLFDSLLLLQGEPPKLNEKIWSIESEKGSMDFPIILEIAPHRDSDRLSVSLHFDRSYMSSQDSSIILEHFAIILQSCLRFPSGRVSDSSLLINNLPSFAGKLNSEKSDLHATELENGELQERPWSKKEEEIRTVLSELSETAACRISLDTTIFQLGLDSINAIQVAAQLRKQGNVVSAADVLEAPLVRQLALLIEPRRMDVRAEAELFDFGSFDRRRRPKVCQQLDIEESSVEAVKPCTPVQGGILSEFLNSDGELYLNHVVAKVDASVGVETLQTAWERTSSNFEMLRTGFIHSDDTTFPFMMIVYHRHFARLPWKEVNNIGDRPFDLINIRDSVKKDVLAALHLPAWRITHWKERDSTYFQFSAHHALYDAQSLNLIFNHVAAVFQDSHTKSELPISPTLGMILDQSARDDGACKFWQGLRDRLCVTKFPNLNTCRIQSTKSLYLKKTCSASVDKLQQGCKEAGITLQAAGQAAWAQILSSYSGEPAITFGLVLSGRDISEEARDVAFPCLVTIPFPCQASGNNKDLIRQIMKLNASIIKHQFTPLAQIERYIGTGKALFDSIFVYQKLSGIDSVEKPWEVIEEETKVNYPVSIELIPNKNQNLELCLTYKEERLPTEQACIILDQLDALLNRAIFEPQHELVDISALESPLLSILPPKNPEIQSDIQLLHEFVEFHARMCPDTVAIEFATSVRDDGKDMRLWTYQELNNLGNQYAHLIQSLGGACGDLIGICFDKCPEAYFAILGILKAGCAYVALDPGAPIARKSFVVKDSNSSMILCTTTHMQDLQQIDQIPIVAVDESDLLKNLSPSPPELAPALSPNNTCYCLYTSGTTGTPKGCEITHENAVQAMLSFQRLFKGHWDADSRWLQFASFHFDVSVLEQYWSWSVGICVTSASRDVIFEDIVKTISRLQITHIDLTPSLARLLHPDDVPSLCRGIFITGGEQLKQEILDAWGDKGVIYNGYGPTEVTIGCTMYPRIPRKAKASNIGPQFENVGSYVMKPDSIVPVLRGGVGELCVSGKLVGRGYLNRPELTAQKFQVLESTGERVYRTGDLVRLLHDGSFEFLGRIDDQVKLRGQRLEVAEIDQVIKDGAGCEVEVSTLVLKHPNQAKDQLVSFVCKSAWRKRPDSPLFQSEDLDRVLLSSVRVACVERLPGYMVPTYIFSVSTMPLSPNNKINTKQLRSMYEATSIEDLRQLTSFGDDSTKVNSEDVRKVIEVIAQQLEIQPSDITGQSNIFELGLDSISAISFARALKQAGFVKARASLIMKNHVIARLAAAVSTSVDNELSVINAQRAAEQNIRAFSHRHAYSISESLNVDLDTIENIAPCTPLQEGMIYRSLNSDRSVYFSSFVFQLADHVNLDRLMIAWKRMQSATQILRTRFVLTPDGYAQVVLKNLQLDWKKASVDKGEKSVDIVGDHSLEFWHQSRDLSGILWKVVILEHETSRLMTLHIFHGLYDGNSLLLMLDLLNFAYTKGEAITQAPSFHQTLAIGSLCEILEAKTFWTQHLDKAHIRSLPLKEEIENTIPSMATIKIQPPSGFQRTRRQLHVTDQSLIQASWVVALAGWFKFVPTLGVVVSGRSIDIEGADCVIGPMFNTIPCHTQLSGITLWSDLVQKCHKFNVSSLPFQHTPLRSIMKWCKRSQHEPLFDTLFVYQKAPVSAQDRKKLWTQIDMPSETDYPLAFEAQMNGDGTLNLTIVAQGGVLSSEEAQSMLEVVEEHLSTLIRAPMAALPPEITDELRGVDPAILPETLESSSAQSNSDLSFPWTERALQIRKTISALAEVNEDKVRHNVSIFELGLDSIDAIRLSSRLRKFEMKISVSTIMQSRSIEKMCAKLEESDVKERPSSEKSIDSWELELRQYFVEMGHDLDDIEYVLPPTPLQEAMVAEMVASGYEHYFNHDVLEIEPKVDTERLLESWKTLVQINAVLRTSFTEIDSPDIPFAYVQVVKKSRQLQLRILDAADDEEFAVQVDRQQKHRPTGLHEDMFWITLVRGPKKSVLLLSVAHALYDGWSLGLLHQDVRSLYAGDMPRRPSYRKILGRILNSSGDSAARFWRGTLAGAPRTNYPPRLSDKSISFKVHRIEKHSQVSVRQAKKFCQSNGITPQALGLTCWAFVLAYNVRRLDVVCGVVLSGRYSDDASEVMFPTMNTVAMRSVIHGTRGEMVRYMQDGLVNVNRYQHYPLRKAIAGTSLGFFNTLFVYQRRPESPEMDLNPLYRSIGGSSEVEYPMCLELEIEGENLKWRTACKDDFLNDSGTENLLDQIDNVLRSAIEHSEEPAIVYSGHEISICGLPSFTIKNFSAGERSQEVGETLEANESEWSPFEMETRSVLSSVSGAPEANIRKSMTLFHLGLDSISAIKVSSLLRKRSIVISVSKILQAATVQNIASAAQSVGDITWEKPPDTETTIRQMLTRSGIYLEQLLETLDLTPSEVERVIPATAGQIFMLSAWQNSEGAIFYPTFHYKIHGDLDPSALDEAWRKLVGQVPILRTRFYGTGDKNHPFLQVVEKSCDNAIFWISESEQSDLETTYNPQSPMVSPPVSLFAYKKPDSTTLSLRIHHALYDGVSLPKLIHRLEDLCNNWVPRHETHVSLADFIAFSHTHSDLTERQSFWKNYLKHDSPYLPTITNAILYERSDIYHPRLIEDVGPLETVARQNGISIQSLFLAGYARVYSRMLQNLKADERPLEHIVVGVYLANRSHALDGLPDFIAPTMNLVPLLIKHAADGSLISVARTIQKDLQEIGSVEHSNVSLVEIEEWTGVKVDCFVNFLKLPDMEREIGMTGKNKERRIRITEVGREGKKASAIPSTLDRSQHVLGPNQMGKNPVSDIYIPSIDVEAAIRDNALDVGVFGPRRLINEETGRRILGELEDLLRGVSGSA